MKALFYVLIFIFATSASSIANDLVPIGMTAESFAELVETSKKIVRDSDLIDPDQNILIAFYGSRTHFNYGYGPVATSDLDVMFIFEKELDPFTMLDFQEENVNVRLAGISDKVKFQVSQEIPMSQILNDILSPDEPSFLNQLRA
jgi:hypothetical protein